MSPLPIPVPQEITSALSSGVRGAPDAPAPTMDTDPSDNPAQPLREVPIDWEALEDAFENNAPEVHSYLHLATGDVLRVVDGVADPQMHARINVDAAYLRVAPVSSREQYRWMERFIPMVDDAELRGKLAASIDGKGAFRRFKDVLMSYASDRERWFEFRSERLRTFMEAWLVAHALTSVPRAAWPSPAEEGAERAEPTESDRQEAREARRARTADGLRKHIRDAIEALGPRELETLAAFAEFLRARRAARAAVAPAAAESAPQEEPPASEPSL